MPQPDHLDAAGARAGERHNKARVYGPDGTIGRTTATGRLAFVYREAPASALEGSAPCKGSEEWDVDVDVSDVADWSRAVEACLVCPLFAACERALDDLYPGWGREPGRERRPNPRNPAGVVWAGRVFTEEGQLLSPYAMRRAAAAKTASERRRQVVSAASDLREVS